MELEFRSALASDLESLVLLLADDPLGSKRENTTLPVDPSYIEAFSAIENDANNHLLIASQEKQLVGMLQLTFIPYLTHMGSWRCLIEGVRIHKNFRGQGLGEQMFEYAINMARDKGCKLVQLTSDKKRPDAIRFYQKLGFEASHEGFKLLL